MDFLPRKVSGKKADKTVQVPGKVLKKNTMVIAAVAKVTEVVALKSEDL